MVRRIFFAPAWTRSQRHPPQVSHRVTVVDSGSPDSTPQMVAAEFPQVRLIARSNIGFSAANNLVLRESEASFVLLLNPDTEITEGALDPCLERIASAADIGMVGCKLVIPSGELDHACKRSLPNRRSVPSPISPAWAAGSGPGEPQPVPGNRIGRRRGGRGGRGQRGLHARPPRGGALGRDSSTRATGSTWRISTGATASGSGAGGSSTSRGERWSTSRGAAAKRGGRIRQEVAFHRGMGRFYRKFYAPSRPAPENLAVYCGILLKLALSLTITLVRRASLPRG